MQTRAAVVTNQDGKISFENLTLEAPRDHEVLVRVVACGICRLDFTMRTSPRTQKPIVLGHEGSGIVEQVGRSVTRVRPGDRVIMSFNSCGHCVSCESGRTAYCLESAKYNFGGQRADGSTALSRHGERIGSHFFGQSSFATYAICTERNAIKVAAEAPLDLLAPLGCGIQTGAGAVLNSLKVTPGSSVVVLGAGSVGLAALMAAKIAGAEKIIAVDLHPSRLELACALGATHVIPANVEDLTAEVLRITGIGANFAVDTSGYVSSIEKVIRALAPLGTMGLISECKGASVSVKAIEMMLRGRSLRGIHQGDSVPEKFIPQLVDHYLHGRLPLEKMVTFYDFDQLETALADMDSGKVIKPVLRMVSPTP